MSKFLSCVLLLPLAGCCAAGGTPGSPNPDSAGATRETSRSFHIRYESDLAGLATGQELRLWIPIPSDDPHQIIHELRVSSPLAHEIATEPVHHNRMVYVHGKVESPAMRVTIDYDVDRFPYRTDAAALAASRGSPPADDLYLRPSKLCIVNDRIRTLAASVGRDKPSTFEKARAFYRHVFDEMTYDKPKDLPWGRGDTVYACDSKVGNCTDFHSYFISLCLAERIPARFQIGLYGEYDPKPGTEYKTGNYHCWAEFQPVSGEWVPVDISEADRFPDKAQFLFGNHTDNRVTLSTGRDLVLCPPQAGEARNFFVNPYAEVDGKPFDGVQKTAYWKDR